MYHPSLLLCDKSDRRFYIRHLTHVVRHRLEPCRCCGESHVKLYKLLVVVDVLPDALGSPKDLMLVWSGGHLGEQHCGHLFVLIDTFILWQLLILSVPFILLFRREDVLDASMKGICCRQDAVANAIMGGISHRLMQS